MALKDLLTKEDFQSIYLQNFPSHEKFSYGAGPVISTGLNKNKDSVLNFKTIPFGKDQPKGGNSKQPYITTAIPEGVDNYNFKAVASFGDNEVGLGQSNNPDQSKFLNILETVGDSLIRGGLVNSGIHSITDALRLAKFGIDLERGIPFLLKQVGLQITNVVIQPPVGGVGGALISKAQNNRLYLPTNTLAQAGVNAFGIHFKRGGLVPSPALGEDDQSGYAYSTKSRNTKITSSTLYYTKNGGKKLTRLPNLLGKFIRKIDGESNDGEKGKLHTKPLYSYIGGPKSVYGIGKTTQRSYVNTLNQSKFFNEDEEDSTPALYNYLSLDQPTSQTQRINPIPKQIIGLSKLKDFRKTKGERYGGVKGTIGAYYQSISSDYSTKNMESRLKIGTGYDLMSQVPIIRATKSLTKAGVNDTYDSKRKSTKDLIRFVIEAVNNDKTTQSDYLFFRAFIDNWGDKYTSKWKKYNFVGNPEPFYNYTSFDRDISISFKIITFNSKEQKPLYQKLNALISYLMPDYSDGNTRARGNYIKLTIGDYIDQLPGFITSLSVSETKGSTWEINLNEEETIQSLPHALDIKMSFQPIHNFIPRKVTQENPNVPFITLNTRNNNAIGVNQYFFPLADDKDSRGAFEDIDATEEAYQKRLEEEAAEIQRLKDIEIAEAKAIEDQRLADEFIDQLERESAQEEAETEAAINAFLDGEEAEENVA